MKIVFACHGSGNGGAERIITTLANEFYDRNYQVVLITTKEAHNEYLMADGIKHIRVLTDSQSKIKSTFQRLSKLRKVMKEEKPECVVSFSSVTNIQILIATLFLKNKIIVSERVDPSRYPTSKIRRVLRLILYPLAHKIVFQTQEGMDFFPNYIKAKGTIIPNPIREHLPAPYMGKRSNIIVGVGSLGEQKNWRMSLEACKEFFKYKPDYRMIIYGEGPLREELQREIDNDSVLKDRVLLAGFADDVVEKINNARIFISSSDYEGISNSMLEALATGVPTICTDCPVGGARSVIVSGNNGFLVNVGDYEDLSKKMIILANDDEMCEKFTRNAVQIKEKLKLDTIVKRWEKEVLE